MNNETRSLPGLHFDVSQKTKDENTKEFGHSIDPENYEFEEYSMNLDHQEVIFPT